jgi:hypothetical protein
MAKTKREPSAVVEYWANEIKQAKKREKDYRKVGEEVLKIYEAENEQSVPFNILYSNTETMAPALYSRVPVPVVQRRFKDEDPLGKAAALAGQRLLAFLLDTNLDGYETFHDVMLSGVMNGLLPGRGESRIVYDAQFLEPSEPLEAGDPAPVLQSELIVAESVQWDRVLYGYVVDFVQLHYAGWAFPAFNVADSAITAGAIGMILDELLRVRRGR